MHPHDLARKGVVPPGHVLLAKTTPARKRSGFDADRDILVSIRDAVRVSPASPWIKDTEQIGVLDLEADPRVLRRFGEEIRAFPVKARVYE